MEDLRSRTSVSEGRLVHKTNRETLVLQPWGRNGLRVRAAAGSDVVDASWALIDPVETDATIEISDSCVSIRNGCISAEIRDIGILSPVAIRDEKIVVENWEIETQKGHLRFFKHIGGRKIPLLSEYDYVVPAHNPGSRTYKEFGDGLYQIELHLATSNRERFYGMGENATASVNLKGCVIDLYQRHIKAVVPFLVSSEGYGFLWNNPSLGRVELGSNRVRWISYGSRQIDYYITAGDSYAEIMEQYADATGHAPEFPFWASGFWQCKCIYKTQEEFLGVARGFKDRSLPLSVLVIDGLHWDIDGNWRLDPRNWPDTKAMVEEMDEMGVRIMVSPWIMVDDRSENYAHMKEHGLFTGSIDGEHDRVGFYGMVHQYDPTNPEAARYLWSKWKENYFDLGIRAFWLDPCDEFHEIEDYDRITFSIGRALEAHAFFPVAHQRNIHDGLVAAGENEVVMICRNAWAGSQRYGTCVAPHDILSSFEHLEEYMKVGLNLSMSGIPWWNVDIGGFWTPDASSHEFQELMVRWYQYGVFMPVFRTHGFRRTNEPWTFGGDSYRHIRAAMFLRERLRLYLMEQMKLATDKGLPPVRPLFFDFEHDRRAIPVEDEFLFGADLLVAPIVHYGSRSRDVYLPSGADWLDAWTGEIRRGGQVARSDAPIEHIPVYVRSTRPELIALFKGLHDE
jgi:alpha-D-xyloside xylohydrolase